MSTNTQTISVVTAATLAAESKPHKRIGPHVHCMLYCKDGWNGTDMQAAPGTPGEHFPVILMCMRFDGKFGFFGGQIEADDARDELRALAREVEEELGWGGFDEACATMVMPGFYIHAVTREQLAAIERGVTLARDFPSETLGLVRVPPVGGWYDTRAGRRPGVSLRSFLQNCFVANSREQLLRAIEAMGWLDPETLRYVTAADT